MQPLRSKEKAILGHVRRHSWLSTDPWSQLGSNLRVVRWSPVSSSTLKCSLLEFLSPLSVFSSLDSGVYHVLKEIHKIFKQKGKKEGWKEGERKKEKEKGKFVTHNKKETKGLTLKLF